MNRFWSILFFLVPILGVAAFAMARWGMGPLSHANLPTSISNSGDKIDEMFHGIHYLAAVILLGTGLTIGWIVWRFDHRRQPNTKALHVHHNLKLELIWSVIPACILIFLAFYQRNSWAENKMNRPTIDVAGASIPQPPMVLVKAKQFGWEFHYAGADGKTATEDDIYIENLLVVPVDEVVVLQMETRDVIHSFYVPELRLKQDIVPGMTHFAWFKANQTGKMEALCTELCGWGHYKMKADLKIVSRPEFDQWLANLTAANMVPSVINKGEK